MNAAGARASADGARQRLASGIVALGLKVSDSAQDSMLRYLDELRAWNRAYNLTAVRDPAEMVTRHVLDALAILPWLETGSRLLDVGSGAGLPAVPLALAAPRLAVTALDSNGKKARFLRHVQRTLPLANLEVIEARVQDYRPAQAFPAVVSRAFAELGDFLRQTAPLVAEDGRWLAMKGKVSSAELESLPPGMRIEAIHPLHVPGLRAARSLVIVRREPRP
ncbi:MAG: 16S rRNA (guanine(527)-N(7))-methyltransferase RsmG [Nevskia sp.]|nr:16S rRNA (guanine(527)-N(7))-methyltransferase RsmG [Nevskia sp.]